jgi:hypothetical protein
MVNLNLFCLVDGESTSNAFPISVPSTDTIGDLKKLIKAEKSVVFNDIDADELTLWSVSVPVVAATKHDTVLVDSLDTKEELLPTDELSDVFVEKPPKENGPHHCATATR